jgi:hypothetical protein
MTDEDKERARALVDFVRDRVSWNRVVGKEHLTAKTILAMALSAMVEDAKVKLRMMETVLLIAQLYTQERKLSKNVDDTPRQ